MLDKIPFEEFEAIVGQTVRVSSQSDHIDVEVKEAHRLANPSPRAEAPFAVVVRENGASRSAGQGVYRLDHPTLGMMDLLFVPIGPDGKGMCYEVTFN